MTWEGAGRRHVERFVVRDDPPPDRGSWPWTVPAVAQVLGEGGIDVPPGVTLLVGENGSGKSTLVEAMARAYPRRGHAPSVGNVTGPVGAREDSPLHRHLRARLTPGASPAGFFLRAELMHGWLQRLPEDPAWRRYADVDWNAQSHGESFLAIIRDRFAEVGVFFLDEPEAALSFTSSLALVALLADMAEEGSQVIVATHSPLLATTPGATILELGDWGIRQVDLADCTLVTQWRDFLAAPGRYLRHLR